MTGFVYAIACGDAVKIGWALDPHARVTNLQCGSAEQLILLGYIDGDRVNEKSLHRKFIDLHIRGEWFRNEGIVSAFIKTLTLQSDPGHSIVSTRTCRPYNGERISGRQCVAARRLLGMNQEALQRLASISPGTLTSFEHGRKDQSSRVADAIESALAAAGAEFVRREDGAEGVVVRAK